MKNIFLQLLILLLATSSVAQSQVRKSSTTQHNSGQAKFVYINGLDLVEPNGKKLMIKGTNLGHWLNPEGYLFLMGKKANSYRLIDEALKEMVGEVVVDSFWRAFQQHYITRDDIRYIKRIGMNTVRIPFHYKLLTDEPFLGYASKKHGYAVLDTVLNWCRQEGLYAILDMHCAPGGQTGDNIDDSYGYPFLFTSEKNKQQFCDLWKELATRYAKNTTVLAYDVLNEPIASSLFKPDTAMLNVELEALLRRVVKDIRTIDKDHIIMLSGSMWGQDYSIFKDWNYDDKLMFTCHRYHFNTSKENLGIKDFLAYREKFQRPFYMGETGHEPNEWIADCVRMLESVNIGWTFWPYKKMGWPLSDTLKQGTPAMDRVIRSRTAMAVIEPSKDWSLVLDYTDADRSTYDAIRKARPDQAKATTALFGLIEKMKFRNCMINEGYIKALGMKP